MHRVKLNVNSKLERFTSLICCIQLSDLASRLAELKRREAKLEAHLSEVTQVKTSCNDALNELSRRQEELSGAATSAGDGASTSSVSPTLDNVKLESARDAVTRATEMQATVAAQLIQLREERRRLGDKLWDLDNEVRPLFVSQRVYTHAVKNLLGLIDVPKKESLLILDSANAHLATTTIYLHVLLL